MLLCRVLFLTLMLSVVAGKLNNKQPPVLPKRELSSEESPEVQESTTEAEEDAALELSLDEDEDETDNVVQKDVSLTGSGGPICQSDRCFRNPGFGDGWSMRIKPRFGTFAGCIENCIPTRLCLDPRWIGDLLDSDVEILNNLWCPLPHFYFILEIMRFIGWECGRCPPPPE